MRWLFLLLLVLNVIYYVWHQQGAPLKVKEVVSLSLYKGSQQDIRLLSESRNAAQVPAREKECLYVGGVETPEVLESLRQRLTSLDIRARKVVGKLVDSTGWWLQISPESQRLLDQTLLSTLSNDFKDLKHKIMLCEGVATVD
ncbi:hypothetical protein [Pseudomonas fontis]|uniref:Sporulation protein n=1 Tax=Pseudomonas fontis TaxID=2942633 RepID=A0ABT5NW26_9PSED|nr:hypothetical protein [Pseudomonas fontis]MDD0975719.1 hypothetical protein [Pseudomonas fontis]MDD0992381.1 hypothetical protein [Pseudomonas fontis]